MIERKHVIFALIFIFIVIIFRISNAISNSDNAYVENEESTVEQISENETSLDELEEEEGESESEECTEQFVENEQEVELTEEEYKELCNELWYDDIFFSKDNLDGKYVKLDLFVEESYFFNSDAMYNIDLSDFIKKYNLKRDFYKCGVKRKTEKSYVGSQISIYFSSDCDIESSDMKIGDHIVIYGKIIDYSIDMMDGYNNCGIIPKYITNNGQ